MPYALSENFPEFVTVCTNLYLEIFRLMFAKPFNVKELLSRYAAGQRDFRNLNLMAANMRNLNLSGINLSGTNLTKANLSGTNLSRTDLSNTVLTGTNLTNANLTQANLTNVDLKDVDLSRAYTQGAILPAAVEK